MSQALVGIVCLHVLAFNFRHFRIIYSHALVISAALGSSDLSWSGRMLESQSILFSFEICLTLPWTFTIPVVILSFFTLFIINRWFIFGIKSQTTRNTRHRFTATILRKQSVSANEIPLLFMFYAILCLPFNTRLCISLSTNTWSPNSLKNTFWLS